MDLTRPSERHLDDADFEAMLNSLDGRTERKIDTGPHDLDNMRLHLGRCSACFERLNILRQAQSELSGLRQFELSPPTSSCDRAIVWSSVAAGLVPDADAKNFLEHAAQCPRCARLLEIAIADLSPAVSAAEEATLATLPGAARRQTGMAKRLGAAAASPRSGNGFRQIVPARRLVAFSTPALLAVGALVLGVVRYRSPSPAQLIAQAYSERRTMELRFRGAGHAARRLEPGLLSSSVARPDSLQRAEELIREGLEKNPDDTALLEDQARADLLDGSPQAALESLERATEAQPDAADVRIDLASAYFMRGEENHTRIDYGRAIDQLSKVLNATPEDSLALFNRAVAEDRLRLYNDELRDWSKFLAVEKDAGWLAEGRDRSDELKKKLAAHKGTSWLPKEKSPRCSGIHRQEA